MGDVAVAWPGGPTCLTFTMTKLSTSGYFSSAQHVRPYSIRENPHERVQLTIKSTVGQRHCDGWSSERDVWAGYLSIEAKMECALHGRRLSDLDRVDGDRRAQISCIVCLAKTVLFWDGGWC